MEITDIYFNSGSKDLTDELLSNKIDSAILKKISEKSGFINRKILGENESHISIIKKLIKENDLVDQLLSCQVIIVVSETQEASIPPNSSWIFNDICDFEKTLVLDLNSGCAGYSQALIMMNSFFVSNQSFKYGAILTTDSYSSFINDQNRSVAPIFGDACSISFFHNNNKNSILSFDNGSEFSKMHSLKTKKKYSDLEMNGSDIFLFVKRKVIDSIFKVCEDIDISEIDKFYVHQASKLVLDEIKKTLKIPSEKIPFINQEIGNTVSTSIPHLLLKDKFLDNKILLKKILISGFGVGLSWSTLLMEM
jgi:3-oxoacyl-[acyl-carrier-protein] synthase-3